MKLKKVNFDWGAVDVDAKECLLILASESESPPHMHFFRKALKCCETKPEVVDREFSYRWAL